jgi:hypothetical protein
MKHSSLSLDTFRHYLEAGLRAKGHAVVVAADGSLGEPSDSVYQHVAIFDVPEQQMVDVENIAYSLLKDYRGGQDFAVHFSLYSPDETRVHGRIEQREQTRWEWSATADSESKQWLPYAAYALVEADDKHLWDMVVSVHTRFTHARVPAGFEARDFKNSTVANSVVAHSDLAIAA